MLNKKFNVIDMEYLQIEAGLCRVLPFLKKKNRLWDKFYIQKEEYVRKPGIILSNFIRKYNANICARSLGVIALK